MVEGPHPVPWGGTPAGARTPLQYARAVNRREPGMPIGARNQITG